MAYAKRIAFLLEMPTAKGVSVAGTFNNWDAAQNPLRKGKEGLWWGKILVPAGRHEYCFVVDGRWISDPNAAESVPNPYGGSNSVLKVEESAAAQL